MCPMTLIARKDLPPNNFKEFLTYFKANSKKMTYGNAGLGAASHLCGLLFLSAVKIDTQTVSYKGTAPAMNDIMGGHVDFMCDQTTSTTAQIKGGTVKVYGVTSGTRVASLPDVPTLDEDGIKGLEVAVWHGLYAPKGTPQASGGQAGQSRCRPRSRMGRCRERSASSARSRWPTAEAPRPRPCRSR